MVIIRKIFNTIDDYLEAAGDNSVIVFYDKYFQNGALFFNGMNFSFKYTLHYEYIFVSEESLVDYRLIGSVCTLKGAMIETAEGVYRTEELAGKYIYDSKTNMKFRFEKPVSRETMMQAIRKWLERIP